jgi:hypothetical protein
VPRARRVPDRELQGLLHRTCSKCGQEKPLDSAYAWQYKAKGVRQGRCKECFASLMKERQKTPELRAHRRAYHHANKEKRNAQRRSNYDPRRSKHSHLKLKYGISIEEYEALLEAQNGVCAVCGQPETARNQHGVKSLAVDHCHKQNKVRALLCAACNVAIGHIREDPEYAARLLDYVERYR